MLPDYRFTRFRFYAPAGVANVRVEGENVIGKWAASWHRYYGERGATLAERFANWGRKHERILEFTKRHGPLTHSPYHQPLEFSFSLESWTRNQWEFRKLWASMQQGRIGRTQQLEVGLVEIRNGWLHFGCGSLWDFMTIELLRKPEKLRFCKRADCDHRYFTAQHGKEQYCSTDCANWAQSKWKKQWHETQRQKRLMKEKGGKAWHSSNAVKRGTATSS